MLLETEFIILVIFKKMNIFQNIYFNHVLFLFNFIRGLCAFYIYVLKQFIYCQYKWLSLYFRI